MEIRGNIVAASGNFINGLQIGSSIQFITGQKFVMDSLANITIGNTDIPTTAGNSLNIAIGNNAMSIGIPAGASQNIAIGNTALARVTTGDNNVAIGYTALSQQLSSDSIGIGYGALDSANALYNIGIGRESLSACTNGVGNIAIGGWRTGYTISTGDYNICIGHNADVSTGGLNKAIAIGYKVVASGTSTVRIGGPECTLQTERIFVQRELITQTIRTGTTTIPATSGTQNIDWSRGDLTLITLDGNITFTFANAFHGQKHVIRIKQDAAGAHTVTWPATVRWPAATAPTLTATSGGIDYIGLLYDAEDGKYDGLANSLNLE